MPNMRTVTIEIPDYTPIAVTAAARVESARAMTEEQNARKVSVINNAYDILCTYLLETFSPLRDFPIHDSEKHILPAGSVELYRRRKNFVDIIFGIDDTHTPVRPVYSGNTLIRRGQANAHAEINLASNSVNLWFNTYDARSMSKADGLAYFSAHKSTWESVKDSINLWIEQVFEYNAEAYEADAQAAKDSADAMTSLLADFSV